jgi:hypothetical protein
MKTMAKVEGLNVSGVISSSIPAGFAVLNQPRIALYYGNVDTMDEGWTRLILDKYGFSYERLNNEAIQKSNLSDYTAIIIPDMSPKNVYEGSAAMPPEYKGGIEAKGIANLRSYVKAGGRLIAMGKASQVPILYNIGIGVELADVSTVNAPGSLLKLNVAKTPFGYGFGESTPAFYEADPAFIVKEGVILATYADDTLMSGYLSDDKKVLPGKAAAVDAPLGKGDVVLLAPDFTYRDQATATIPFLWNAILL